MSGHASSSGSNGSSRWKSRDQLPSTKKALSKAVRGSITNSNETKRRDQGGAGEGDESGKRKKERQAKYVTVWSQVQLIRYVSGAEIAGAVIIVLAQTVAIAASNEFATRSLTGIWTAWFFFMAAGLALLWSARCTFNGLLAVLVLQIISATMAIPLFTACCTVLVVYKFKWDPDFDGNVILFILWFTVTFLQNIFPVSKKCDIIIGILQESLREAIVGSSIIIMSTNLLMVFLSILELGLNVFNSYLLYSLAYGGLVVESVESAYEYDENSVKSAGSVDLHYHETSLHVNQHQHKLEEKAKTVVVEVDPHMPKTPKNAMIDRQDAIILTHCGLISTICGIVILIAQITMLALAYNNKGIKIGIGVWGALFYFMTGIVTVYNGWKPSPQSTVGIFILQVVQLVLTVPLVGISYYIVAVFGSCLQQSPHQDCTGFRVADLTVTIMGAIMALCGMVQGLMSLILSFICSQAVCGIQCMISGATVYPTL